MGSKRTHRDPWVAVCAECLRASCWLGEFYCENAKGGSLVKIRRSAAKKLKLESPHYLHSAEILVERAPLKEYAPDTKPRAKE